MFGFEMQTSGNHFLTGVGYRETAFVTDDKLLSLEGDETSAPGTSAELEFVTAPCPGIPAGQLAVGHAQALARHLAQLARPTGTGGRCLPLTFQKGDRIDTAEVKGVWERTCTIHIGDPLFRAQWQATVGTPLAGLGRFVKTVLERSGTAWEVGNHLPLLEELIGFAKENSGGTQLSRELDGFLRYCYLFLIRSLQSDHKRSTVIGQQEMELLPDMYKVFNLTGRAYIDNLAYAKDEKQPTVMSPCFPDGLVAVGTDSPKSEYSVLPRTDFHSMFNALPKTDRALLTKVGIEMVLPQQKRFLPPEGTYLQTYPYRAEAEARDTAQRIENDLYVPQARLANPTGPDDPTWPLVLHGPSLVEWWNSVVAGDEKRQYMGSNLPKDAMSPPPGYRGREPQYLGEFPTPSEDKKNFYGMGAFPMDRGAADPLAVAEHRNFMQDKDLKPLTDDSGLVPLANWAAAAKVFTDHYLPE
jgi:hypothetical protein